MQLLDYQTVRENAEKEAQEILTKALQSAMGGDAEWDLYLASWKVESLSAEKRKDLLQGEVKLTKGALPYEVRQVLEVWEKKGLDEAKQVVKAYQKAIKQAEETEDYEGEEALAQQLRPFEWDVRAYLMDTKESCMRSYLQSVKKKNKGIGSVFANAMKTSVKYTMTETSTAAALCCPSCGSPRMTTAVETICNFCGTDLL